MSRFIAVLLSWLGLGVIITEILNNSNLFDFRLKVYFVLGPILLIFLFSELILKHFKNRARSSKADENKYKRIITTYHLFLGLIGLCFLISIPFLWWGVIKKLAMLVNQ